MDSLTLSDVFWICTVPMSIHMIFSTKARPQNRRNVTEKQKPCISITSTPKSSFEHSTKQTMMKQLRVVDTPKKRMVQQVDGGIRISAEHSVLATVQQEGTNFFNMQRIRD